MAHDFVGQLSKRSCERCSQRLYACVPRWWMQLTWLQLCDAWACYCLDQRQGIARHAGRAWGYEKFTLREVCRVGRVAYVAVVVLACVAHRSWSTAGGGTAAMSLGFVVSSLTTAREVACVVLSANASLFSAGSSLIATSAAGSVREGILMTQAPWLHLRGLLASPVLRCSARCRFLRVCRHAHREWLLFGRGQSAIYARDRAQSSHVHGLP